MNNNLIIIGVAGGSGSGKSSIAKYILNYYSSNKCSIIEVDSYYRDLKHLVMEDREKNNFDHPKSIDFDLLIKHLNDIQLGKSISVPIYDYKTHTRTNRVNFIKPDKIVIIEGLFALINNKVRNFMDIKVFVETDKDSRLKRRIKRDMRDRARTYESIISQYNKSVEPMYLKHIEPTKKFSDLIITQGVKNTIAMEQLISKIKHMKKDINKAE